MSSTFRWKLHGDGVHIEPGEAVAPDERLTWPRTIGIGTQHVVAMFGSTFLVPLLTGFPPATTLLFSGLGTILFLLITRNRIPSYLGSSFAFIAPIAAATSDYGYAGALGGVVMAGVTLFLIGVLVQAVGVRWIEVLMPPVVTGAIVALIGLNLAPSAKTNFMAGPVTALVTLVAIVLWGVLFKGFIGRLSILFGVIIGYVVAALRGEIDYSSISEAAWFGLPHLQTPTFHLATVGLFVPVVFVLIAENIGHVRSVGLMVNRNLDENIGRTLMSDGLATTLAGFGGGSGTTTYAENIGVMASTKVYSTAAYWVAGIVAIGLSLFPKFGAAIATVPAGVLGGAGVVLYGMIGVLGVRIWVENKVDFSKSINLTTAAVSLIIAIADFTWQWGQLSFGGIALGTFAAIAVYHVMRGVSGLRGGRAVTPVTPGSTERADESH
ncbi:uracil-xanthine permease family protein [Pseudoclavibacter soli]|uniref:uracil-xanthine permease family protein n=1 Tax=Pseudoclavibacter soli TaxID=452623 RepID=UPI00040B3760|nr:solute carrier family 23 protein [Pseudoclavibacter soli]